MCSGGEITNTHNTGNVTSINGVSVGGVCGYVSGKSTINSCSNSGDVRELPSAQSSRGSTCGGIVGDLLDNSTILKCANIGNVESPSYGAGGIAANTNIASIDNCYNTGNIKSQRGLIGGITTMNSSNLNSVISCYNVGTLVKAENADLESGGIVAIRNLSDEINISNCYYLDGTHVGGINASDTPGKAEAKSRDNMINTNFVNTLNNGSKDNPWKKGKEYPILSWQNESSS